MRLVRGDYGNPTVYADDPRDVAAGFAAAGASRVHVVDLDAARGTGQNRDVIEAVVRRSGVQVQVAGGVRSARDVAALLEAGAEAVVMGTAAVRDPLLLERCARDRPGRVFAALDVRGEAAAVSGWTETEPVPMEELVGRWDGLPLAGVILTCIERDGTLSGPDLETLARVEGLTGHAVHYSGGIGSMDDIRHVAVAGARAVILGKALYEGRVKLEDALAG